MDISYRTPGMYVPYLPSSFGMVSPGSPSPPPSICSAPSVCSAPSSVCSEPLLQFPIVNGRCESPGLIEPQLKPPRIQLLNTSMVDACKKKSMAGRGIKLPPRVESSEMINFFQTFSESGDGSMRGGSVSPQFSYNTSPLHFPQPKPTPFQYPQLDSTFHYTQSQLDLQRKTLAFIQCENQNKLTYQQQERDNVGSSPRAWGALPPKSDSVPYPPTTTVNLPAPTQHGDGRSGALRTETKMENESKSMQKQPSTTAKRKKGMITTTKDTMKKDRNKHNLMVRKQRKRVQQKNKSLNKTELCTHWTLTSTCTFKGKCYFAHGIDELRNRMRVGNYKTKPCVDCPPEKGSCTFASRCNYCHPGEAIRRPVGSTYFDKDYYKDLKNEFQQNDYPFGIFV